MTAVGAPTGSRDPQPARAEAARPQVSTARPRRRISTAAILAVGSELTTGATRDTNAAELAAALAADGVEVVGIGLLPDRLELVTAALAEALDRSDLVLTTGGLGPTPDDLTREAIAAVCNETPVVDPRLEAALRRLWRRRGLPYPLSNVKQAWRIPSARPIPNPNGTAPGWWVERPDGRLVVALPGPPRELRPMWRDWVLPRLRRRGLGRSHVTRTLRTFGIGESQLVELLGEALLRAENPRVATYARQDAVDIVIVAWDEEPGRGRRRQPAAALVAATEAAIRARIGDAVWGVDDDTWPAVLGRLLAGRGWRLAVAEAGTGGSLIALLEPLVLAGGIVRDEVGPADAAPRPDATDLLDRAAAVRSAAGAEVGLAVRFVPAEPDATVEIGIIDPSGQHGDRRRVFGTGSQARLRAALAAADALRRRLLAVGAARAEGPTTAERA